MFNRCDLHISQFFLTQFVFQVNGHQIALPSTTLNLLITKLLNLPHLQYTHDHQQTRHKLHKSQIDQVLQFYEAVVQQDEWTSFHNHDIPFWSLLSDLQGNNPVWWCIDVNYPLRSLHKRFLHDRHKQQRRNTWANF